MIHPLIRKELWEHRAVLIAMWALLALAVLLLLVAARRQGNPLVVWKQVLVLFGPLLALALANRFVVREYGGRTQLFLETLPIGRSQVITLKWLTSAACLLLPMLLCFGFILLVATVTADLTPRFVGVLALRGIVFLLFVHALAFFVGLMGRYRYVLWLSLVTLGVIANLFWQTPLMQWPPLQLVSSAMPFERDVMPIRALWITGAATTVLIGAAFGLALGFRGSWVVALARRMSLQEKIVVAAAFLSVAYALYLVEDRKPKPPFRLRNAVASRAPLPEVLVARTDGLQEQVAREVSQSIATDLQSARNSLGLSFLPVVAVLPDASLDGDLFLNADLPDSDGVVVRGAVGAPRFDLSGFRAHTLREVLVWYTKGRAAGEQRRWLLDGFSRRQVAGRDERQRVLLRLRASSAMQALSDEKIDLSRALQQWLTTREILGDCLSDALAWRTTELLAASMGEARFKELARALFGQSPPGDFRGFLLEQSLDNLLQSTGAPGIAVLAERLREEERGEQAHYAEQPPVLPHWSATFRAMPMQGSLFELQHAVADAGGQVPSAYAVRYKRIGPWEGEIARSGMERVDVDAPGVLPASFSRGEWVFTAVELLSQELQCTLRVGARRWVVQ